MKPFRNAFEAIKRLLRRLGGKKEPEEAYSQTTEPEVPDVAEAPKKPEISEAEAKKQQEEAMKEAAAKIAAAEEAAAKAAEKSGKNKGPAKPQPSPQQKKDNYQKTIDEAEKAEQKKYEEEVKKRAERTAKRQEAESRHDEKKIVDPVTGEEIELNAIPEEAIYLKKYMKLPTTANDILVTMNSIAKHPDMPKNIVILGRNGFGTVKVGEDFARSFYACGLVKSDKIAKIKAKQLNKIGLEKLAGLKGGCLIIENAGLVSFNKLVEVIKNSEPDQNDYVVILTGEIDSIANFFEENPDIVDAFIYLIDIHKISEVGMANLARGYIKEKGYKADKDVIDKLKASLKMMEGGNIDRFIELIDGGMAKCDTREEVSGNTRKELAVADF